MSNSNTQPDNYVYTFSERLKKILGEQTKSQSELGDKIGIAQPTLSSYINGEKFPPLKKACAIASELGVSLDWLCGLKDNNSQITNDKSKMLLLIANIIEGNAATWKARIDVAVQIENEQMELENSEVFSAAICSCDNHFRCFIVDYKAAIDAGLDAMYNYHLDKEVAESMKQAVLDKYLKIFEEAGIE